VTHTPSRPTARDFAFTARSRNTGGYLDLLGRLDRANPVGDLYVIADNLNSHTSRPIQAWLADHPVPLPVRPSPTTPTSNARWPAPPHGSTTTSRPGSGAVHRPPHDITAAASPTVFEERSTKTSYLRDEPLRADTRRHPWKRLQPRECWRRRRAHVDFEEKVSDVRHGTGPEDTRAVSGTTETRHVGMIRIPRAER
jgi:hypothetical protein